MRNEGLALELSETSFAENDVVDSPMLHATIEELRVTLPRTKIPYRLLSLPKNYAVRGEAALVSVNCFRRFDVGVLAVVAGELASFCSANRGDQQHSMFCGKANSSAAAHDGRTQPGAVGRGDMLREQFGFPTRIGDRK